MRGLLFVSLFALTTAGLAGCIDASEPVDTDDPTGAVLDLLAGQALWQDPQNTPHPAFGYATMSSPPGATNATGLPAWWAPIPAAELPDVISGIGLLAPTPSGVGSGGGISLFGSLAVVPGYTEDTSLVDISDPAAPVEVGEIPGRHRGSATIAYPNGTLVAIFSTSQNIEVWDITDPTDPDQLPTLEPTQGSHKVGVVPGTPIVYNAASDGGSHVDQLAEGVTEIFDLTDPANPVHVMDWANGYSCHHVYFWNDVANEKYRGLCAGIEATQIWDTTDPLDPKVIVTVPVHHGVAGTPSASVPLEAFSHYAGLSMDGTVLIVGDENGGGGVPPGCVASVETPQGAVSTPVGALWFYDVTDESDPMLLGWYSPLNDPRFKADALTSCTAHHGRLVPDPQGRDLLAMSFYGAGVVLVDFTDVPQVHVIDQFADGSDTWETWYYNGYLFTGDLARGMDVLTFE